MPVTSYDVGDRFIFRVFKALGANPDNVWVNNYEAVALVAGAEGALLTMGNALVTFEKQFHHDAVQFQRLVISTWEPDSVPYDPAAFISVSLSGNGNVGPVTDLVSLDKALSVARVCAFGRVGHLFYRGVLEEAEVSSPAGKSVLTSRAAIQEKIDDALAAASMEDYLGPEAVNLQISMINADGDQVRQVVGLSVAGVATIKTDHLWFNRNTITVP